MFLNKQFLFLHLLPGLLISIRNQFTNFCTAWSLSLLRVANPRFCALQGCGDPFFSHTSVNRNPSCSSGLSGLLQKRSSSKTCVLLASLNPKFFNLCLLVKHRFHCHVHTPSDSSHLFPRGYLRHPCPSAPLGVRWVLSCITNHRSSVF